MTDKASGFVDEDIELFSWGGDEWKGVCPEPRRIKPRANARQQLCAVCQRWRFAEEQCKDFKIRRR